MRGLYLITNDDPFPILFEKLKVALATQQIAILQYRRKKVEFEQQLEEIEKIKNLCEQYETPFVINDNLALAAKFSLGVHLGQGDGEIVDAVQQLQKHKKIIGRTCKNSLDFAKTAISEGATYVAFGAIYATATKPEAGSFGIEVVRQARKIFDVPICAIGGLTVENAQPVIDAGADLCAVISDILGREIQDIPARIYAWAKLFHIEEK